MNKYKKFAKYYLKQILSDRKGFDICGLDKKIQLEIIQELQKELEKHFLPRESS